MNAEYLLAPRGIKGTFPSIADRIDAHGDCWEWTGCIHSAGYGMTSVNRKTSLVHRVVWEALVGPIPKKLQIDHLCRNRKCCNPDHLDLVTTGENIRRGNTGRKNKIKTHCPYGHPYSGNNLKVNPNGSRKCQACIGWKGYVSNGDKTLCKRGHPLSGPNLYIVPSTGHRRCRECQRVYQNRIRA